MISPDWVMATAGKGGAWLLLWSWQSFALLLCVWLGVKIFPAKTPALRHQVWLCGLIVVASLPLWALIPQQLSLRLPQPANRVLSFAVEIPKVIITADTNAATTTATPPRPALTSAKGLIWPSIFIVWFAGALVIVARLVEQSVKLWRARLNARPAAFVDLDCRELASRKVNISLSSEISSPVLIGLRRPTILLPADIADWTKPEERLNIDNLKYESAILQLKMIAQSDASPEVREMAMKVIARLEETQDPNRVLPPPPPPPPPPAEIMAVASDKPLAPLPGQEDSVFALLREATYASIHHDTSVLERILTEDYISIGPDGEIRNKAQDIADIKRRDRSINRVEFDDLSVSGNENWAFATFLGTVYFQVDGQESTAQFRYTVNFTKVEGKWKIFAIHLSRKQ
jgi:ketosteroid isomerase-like protein